MQNCDMSKLEGEEKSRMPRDLLSDHRFENAHARIFIRPLTLTGHSFAALWAIMMKCSSFESPKLYLLALNSKNSIVALLTPVSNWFFWSKNSPLHLTTRLCWSVLSSKAIFNHFWCFLNWHKMFLKFILIDFFFAILQIVISATPSRRITGWYDSDIVSSRLHTGNCSLVSKFLEIVVAFINNSAPEQFGFYTIHFYLTSVIEKLSETELNWVEVRLCFLEIQMIERLRDDCTRITQG